MDELGFLPVHAGQRISRQQIPRLELSDFRDAVVHAVYSGRRIAALFGDAPVASQPIELYAVLADSARGVLLVARTSLASDEFPSLTPECPTICP